MCCLESLKRNTLAVLLLFRGQHLSASISRALFVFLGEKSSHGMQPMCPLCRQGRILAASDVGPHSSHTEEHPKQSTKRTHISIRASRWFSGKESACQCRTPRFHPWVGRFPGEGNGFPLQYSCLENSVDRGTWRATVPRVAESDMTEATEHSTCRK